VTGVLGGCLIRNGTVVTSEGVQDADVAMRDGIITAIAKGLAPGAGQVIEAAGHLVLPGGVDPHVHLEAGTQGQRTADDFFTGTRAAAVGGTTTVMDFCYQLPGRPFAEAIATRRAAAEGRAVVDFAFHFVVTNLEADNVEQLDAVCAAGVTSFKTYMAYPKRGLMADDGTLFRLFERAAGLGALPVVHAENGLVNDVLVQEALALGAVGPAQHPKAHPAASEAEGTHRAVAIAEMSGTPLYFVHVSCAEALAEIHAGRRRGQTIFAETCPHYLLLDDSLYGLPDFESAKYVMNPPLRDARNLPVLWEALERQEIDTVASDHCPFNFHGQKDRGREDFSKIPNGAPGIEHRIALLFDEGVRSGRLSMERWVDAFASAPARIFGLTGKGRVAVGADADLVIFDPDREVVIRQEDHHMNVDYSLYEGRTIRGCPRTVLSRGEVIVRDGEYIGADGRGRYLHRTTDRRLS
jgi:dihydropyrimidinase